MISHGTGTGSAADFAKDIKDVGSATIRPRDPDYGSHDPNSSFQHLQSPLPTVIIEVAHSQDGGKLRALAEEYILGSDLEIRVVVGVDIEYTKIRRASFSVWRAESEGPDDDKVWSVVPIVANQVFRKDDGTPCNEKDVGLRLPLMVFADCHTCERFKDMEEREIFVSCAELHQYVEEAEAFARLAKSIRSAPYARLKKRRCTETPEEQLADRGEDAYAQAEEYVSPRPGRCFL